MEDQAEMDAHNSNATASTESPGALLQAARKAKQLSQADVARQLRLSVQWISDIEHDDYRHGAALIYIRGYLRSYARLLGLSTDRIIAAFETLGLGERFQKAKSNEEKLALQPTAPVFSKQTRIISGRAVRWLSGIAILVLIILVALWWQGQRKHSLNQVSQVQQPQLPLQPQVGVSAPAAVKPAAGKRG